MIYTFFSSVFITLFMVLGTIAMYGFLDLARRYYDLTWKNYQVVCILAALSFVCFILAVVFGFQIPDCYVCWKIPKTGFEKTSCFVDHGKSGAKVVITPSGWCGRLPAFWKQNQSFEPQCCTDNAWGSRCLDRLTGRRPLKEKLSSPP